MARNPRGNFTQPSKSKLGRRVGERRDENVVHASAASFVRSFLVLNEGGDFMEMPARFDGPKLNWRHGKYLEEGL